MAKGEEVRITTKEEETRRRALERKRMRQEMEALDKILKALEPLEPEPQQRVLRSAWHFIGMSERSAF